MTSRLADRILTKFRHDDIIREDSEVGPVRLTTFTRIGEQDPKLITRVDCLDHATNEFLSIHFEEGILTNEEKDAYIDHCIPILKADLDKSVALLKAGRE